MTPRLSRRALLKSLGLAAGAAATTAAVPPNRLLDTRSPVAPDAPAVRLVRAGPVQGRRAAVLARLDDTHRVFADGTREFLLRARDEQRLRAAGIPFEVLDPDVLAGQRMPADRAIGLQPGQRDDYRLWEDFEADLRMLAEQNPTRARLLELPVPSLAGRTVYGIEIATDVSREDGRPVIHMDGAHHAREWPAPEMPIMWAFDLLESYGTDPRVTGIVDNARTVIVPNVNPDGFIRSRESLVAVNSSNDIAGLGQLALGAAGLESYWRKNLRNLSGVSASAGTPVYRYDNPDAYGIDLNRNYAFLWGDDEGSSGDPYDQTYRGTAPYSEPESRNVRSVFLSRAPIAAITHHTSGETMLYPWGRDPDSHRTRDWEILWDLGVQFSATNGYEPKQSFGLYPTSGTSRDWGHAITSTLIYTFEHGREFHGPYDTTIPAMYAKNRGVFLELSEAALDPALHARIVGEVRLGGEPVPATIRVTKPAKTPTWQQEMIDEPIDVSMTAAEDGSFTFHVPPSTRPFLETAPADPTDRANPRGNPYPGGPDPVAEWFGGVQKEAWTVVIEGPGGRTATREVVVDRGDVADLGTVEL